MPFTRDMIEPYGGNTEMADEINAAVERIRGTCAQNLTLNVRFKAPDLGSQAAVLHQTLIHRTLDMVDGAIAAWQLGNVMESVVLSRAFMETAALGYWYVTALARELDGRDPRAIHELNMRLTFGARQESSKFPGVKDAVNVLNGIDLYTKRGMDVRWAYEDLSESAHPNGRGLLEFYGSIDHATRIVTFEHLERNKERFVRSILAATSLVLLMDRDMGRLGELVSNLHAFEDEIGGFELNSETEHLTVAS